MPDSKITALTSISTSTDPANDPLVIVDVSDTSMAASGTTKKVTLNNLLACSPTATLASATITGDLNVSGNGAFGTGTGYAALQRALIPVGENGVTSLDFRWYSTGTTYTTGARVHSSSDAAWTASSTPARLMFSTVPSGSTSLSERYRIDNAGIHTWQNVGGVAGTAMTLNSTGLGVGVASPAVKLDIGGAATQQFRIQMSGQADTRVISDTGAGIIGTYSNHRLIIRTNSTDAVTVDASQNVGIGVAPNSLWAIGKVLQIGSTSGSFLYGAGGQLITGVNAYYDTAWKYAANGRANYYQQSSGIHSWFYDSGTQVAGTAANFVQAMTLDASGNLLVGTTTNGGNGVSIRPSTASPNVVLVGSDTSGGTSWQLYSTGTSSNRFYVTWAGVVNAVNTTISGISDARLKENVQDIDVGLGAILALKPRKFDWKAGKGKDIKGDRGFIAQEFEQVFPQLVDEWADPAPEGEAPYKSVRQDLIPVLVKAIQELAARVQTLEAK